MWGGVGRVERTTSHFIPPFVSPVSFHRSLTADSPGCSEDRDLGCEGGGSGEGAGAEDGGPGDEGGEHYGWWGGEGSGRERKKRERASDARSARLHARFYLLLTFHTITKPCARVVPHSSFVGLSTPPSLNLSSSAPLEVMTDVTKDSGSQAASQSER